MFVPRLMGTVAFAAVAVRSLPLPLAARLVARRALPPRRVPTPERVAALTDRVLKWDLGPWRPGCVARSMVLLRYLPHPTVLRFGVRPQVRPLDGHAWVERDGRPAFETTDPRGLYEVTWSWPS
jgi:hypothetical protein